MLSKNYSVARVVQYTAADIGKSERHIERKNESYENMNVDLSRTPLNVHFRGCGELTYNTRLDELVAAGAVSLRGLKKDAKVFDEMIFDVNTAYFEDHGGYPHPKAERQKRRTEKRVRDRPCGQPSSERELHQPEQAGAGSVTIVAVVTIKMRVEAVSKIPSQSSQPSHGVPGKPDGFLGRGGAA